MQLGTSNVYMKKKLTWKEREKKTNETVVVGGVEGSAV